MRAGRVGLLAGLVGLALAVGAPAAAQPAPEGTPGAEAPAGAEAPSGAEGSPDYGYGPQPRLEIEIIKSAEPAEVRPGDRVRYLITVSNTGPVTFADAWIVDDLSGVLDDATFADDAEASVGTVEQIAPDQLRWVGDLAPGEEARISYSVIVNSPPAGGEEQPTGQMPAPEAGDGELHNVVIGPPESNCEEGSTDERCETRTPVTPEETPVVPVGLPDTGLPPVVPLVLIALGLAAGGSALWLVGRRRTGIG